MKELMSARNLAFVLCNANIPSLQKLINDENISISYNSLFSLQSFYRNVAGRSPFPEEIVFFNSFAKTLKANPYLVSINSMITSDEFIAKTQEDLAKNYSEICKNYRLPCSLGNAFEISKDVVEGRMERKFNGSFTELFAGSDKNLLEMRSIIKGYIPTYSNEHLTIAAQGKEKKSWKNINPKKEYEVAIFYCPSDENGDMLKTFIAKYCQFMDFNGIFANYSDQIFGDIFEYTNKISVALDKAGKCYDRYAEEKAVKNGGVFEDFSSLEFSRKLREECDSFPLTYGENMSLKASKVLFTKEVLGKYAFAIIGPKNKINSICTAAEKSDIRVCRALHIPKSAKNEITLNGNAILSYNYNLFGIFTFPKYINAVIKKADCNTNLPPCNTERVLLNIRENLYSSKVSLEDSENPYALTVKAMLSPFISAIYDGKNLKNSDFAYTLNFSIPFSKFEDFGKGYASVLGSYRTVCELGLAPENMNICISDKSSVETFLKVTSFKDSQEFFSDFDKEQFLSKISDENQIPCFDTFRKILNGNSQEEKAEI